MRPFLRKLRGALGIATTWGVSWGLIGAALSIITGIVDPPSIDAGEGPLRMAAIFGAVGAMSAFAFGLVMSAIIVMVLGRAMAGRPIFMANAKVS